MNARLEIGDECWVIVPNGRKDRLARITGQAKDPRCWSLQRTDTLKKCRFAARKEFCYPLVPTHKSQTQ